MPWPQLRWPKWTHYDDSFDPSDPTGFTKLENIIVDHAHTALELLLEDQQRGFPFVKNVLVTLLLAYLLMKGIASMIRSTFFSYRQYVKAPILTLDMHDGEPSFLRSPSVTTVTFYRGGAPLVLIRRRLLNIIKANPWLTARLVQDQGKYSFKYSGSWDSDSVVDHFEITDDKSLVVELDYETLIKKVERFVIGNGLACVDKNVPLFKVSIVQNPSGFAFIMSLSHTIADGRTFYNIYEMFDGELSAVRSLPVERMQEFPDECAAKSGVQGYFKSLPFVLRIIYFMFLEPKKPKAQIYKIERSWVERQKEAVKAVKGGKSTPADSEVFVSTNDVLVSWWAKRAQFDYCMMAVNFRDRFTGLSQDRAGNYSGAMVLYPDEFQSPLGIRAVISKFLNAPEKLPSTSETLKFNCGICTNWTTFYKDVTFGSSSCTQLRHLPVFLGGSSRFPCTMVLFCPKAGEIAALIGSSNAKLADRLFAEGGGPCGELLMQYKSK